MKDKLMIGLVGMVCGILLVCGCMGISNLVAKDPNTRSVKTKTTSTATATTKYYYYEDGDYTSMEFTDETGNMWIVDDCVCNLLLTFDTKDTEEIEDDEIIFIGISVTISQ